MSPQKFWTAVQEIVSAGLAKVTPVRATVTALPSGLVQLQRVGADDPDVAQYARLKGFDFAVSDDLLCLQYHGTLVPIGVLQQAVPTDYSVPGTFAATAFNSPLAITASQTTSDTASTTSTSTYQQALSASFTLGVGTWTVVAWGGAGFTHSASGNVDFYVEIDGSGGLSRSITVSPTNFLSNTDPGTNTGVAGNRSITLRVVYRSNTTGTTTCNAPWLAALALRTA